MMLRTLRNIRGLTLFALLVIVSSVPTSLVSFLHDADDDPCEVGLVAHDGTAPRIGSAHPIVPASPHCLICHWLQSVQTTVATPAFVVQVTGEHNVAIIYRPFVRAPARSRISDRAPPLAV